MAITNATFPASKVFTLNPAWSRCDATGLVTSEDTQYQGISGLDATAGIIYRIKNELLGIDITLTVVNAYPSDWATEIPSLSHLISEGDIVAGPSAFGDWVVQAFAHAFTTDDFKTAHPAFGENYTSDPSSVGSHIITAKFAGEIYNLDLFSYDSIEATVLQEGQSFASQQNYTVEHRILVGGNPIGVVKSLPRLGVTLIEQDLRQFLHDYLTPRETPPDADLAAAVHLSELVVSYTVQIAEVYGDPAEDQDTTASTSRVAVRGGYPDRVAPYKGGPDDFIGNTKPLLSLCPATDKPTSKTTPEFCSVLTSAASTTHYILVELLFQDGTTENYSAYTFTTASGTSTRVHLLPCGYEALDIATHDDDAENPVVGWSVWVDTVNDLDTAAVARRGPLSYRLTAVSSLERVFLLQTRFGTFETLRARGSCEGELSAAIETAVRTLPYAYTRTYHAKTKAVGPVEAMWTQRVGVMPREWAKYLADEILASERVWVLEEGEWVPVRVESDSVKIGLKESPVVDWEFDWSYAL